MTKLPEKTARRIGEATLFLLDLDGTIYLGNKPIPGAKEFIDRLARNGTGYVFLTNNSSHTAGDYLVKLQALGFHAGIENVFTSGQATGMYLAEQKPGARIFVLGTEALRGELASFGLTPSREGTEVDFVVAGFDTELTYEKLSRACSLIDRGVAYIATNPDYVCPIEGDRYLPDCGSICFMIEQATGKKPLVIGKPDRAMADLVCRRFATPTERTILIGDRLYTDIALGRNAGIFTICVLTGETKRSDIEASSVKPDCIIESVADLNPVLDAIRNHGS